MRDDAGIDDCYIKIAMQKQVEEELPPVTHDVYLTSFRQRMALREVNFDKSGAGFQSKPKSAQIKAIQKFIGRLKSDNKNHQAILVEMQGLNLSKYVQEISALIASCVSEKQIRFYSEVATRLKQEYEDVPAMLLKDLNKQFNNAYQSTEDNKQKLKTVLLFTTELFVCGFPFPYKDISEMLKKLVKAGTRKRSNFNTEKELRLFAYFYNCDTYSAFLVSFGTIFTQATPKWVHKWRELQKEIVKYPDMIPTKIKDDITNVFFCNYISSCMTVLEAAFGKIKELQGELRENLRMSGEFNKLVEANYLELKEKFIFTKIHLSLIIDAVSSKVQLRDYEKELVEVDEIMKKYINKLDNVEIFENEFERELYLDLPELCKTQNKAATDEDYREFKQRLDRCKNKNDSDQIAQMFENVNNKRTRKMLAKDTLQYRKQYQLVTPFLCRIAAIVSLNFKDIMETTTESLFNEYEKLRENINVNFVVNDKRSRNLKYICQFTKFKVIDSQRTITCIQNLIDDLKGYNIQLLISALESVGRFLYLSPAQATKFTFLLSKLDNVMKQRSFPLFTTSQLLNSVSLLKPHQEPPRPPAPEPSLTEKEALRILKLDIIDELQIMLPQLKKLIKTDEGLKAAQEHIIKQIENYDFLGSYHYAYMLTQLDSEPIIDFVVQKTITLLEEAIRASNYQICLLWSRFLGELYKYNLIRRTFFFDQLSNFLKIGGSEITVINLICTVLETCENYLQSKKISQRNQKFLFLVDFKRYINNCSYVPMLEQFKIIDVFQQLEPNLTTITPPVLTAFFKEQEERNGKEVDIAKALDLYLDRKNLKEVKPNQIPATQDPRVVRQPQTEEQTGERNIQIVAAESKQFESEFLSVMSSNMKDFSGRIAKPAFVEKIIERRKQKRKIGEGERKIVIIGRNANNKFTRKDVVYAAQGSCTQSDIAK